MKFRIPELFLGCFLTVAVFCTGMIFSTAFQPNGAVSSFVKSSVAHSDTADDRIARYTLWLAILTGGLVLASCFQFYFLNRAEKTSQSLANLAREEFIATHRPRVIVRFIQGPFHDDAGHEFIWVTFANVGETMATITAIGGDLARRNPSTGAWRSPGVDASPNPITPISLESGERHVVTVTAKAPISDIELLGDATGTHELVQLVVSSTKTVTAERGKPLSSASTTAARASLSRKIGRMIRRLRLAGLVEVCPLRSCVITSVLLIRSGAAPAQTLL